MAATMQDTGLTTETVCISGAKLRLTPSDGYDFVWVHLLDDKGSARPVGYFHQLDTDDPRRRWFGTVPAWRSNLDIPLRTLYDHVWQLWARRCPIAAKRVSSHGA